MENDADGTEAATLRRTVSFDGKHVLDVGCGKGRITRVVAARAASVHAFDPNAESIAEAQSLLPAELVGRVTFAVHGVEALEVPRRRFDLAVAGWSLWCVDPEGVVDALRKIRSTLDPRGLLVDLQPIDGRPLVTANGQEIGVLDMREWAETLVAVERGFATAISEGVFALEHEEQYVTIERFDDGAEFVETQRVARGTHLDDELAARATAAVPPLRVHSKTRLRVLSIP